MILCPLTHPTQPSPPSQWPPPPQWTCKQAPTSLLILIIFFKLYISKPSISQPSTSQPYIFQSSILLSAYSLNPPFPYFLFPYSLFLNPPSPPPPPPPWVPQRAPAPAAALTPDARNYLGVLDGTGVPPPKYSAEKPSDRRPSRRRIPDVYVLYITFVLKFGYLQFLMVCFFYFSPEIELLLFEGFIDSPQNSRSYDNLCEISWHPEKFQHT